MKISKLFHWLYAILMFLPILVFIPNAFYYGFNEQAVAQEKITYEQQEVTFNQIIINGNFANRTNNWILNNATISFDSYGAIVVTTANNGGIIQNISITNNHKYYIFYDSQDSISIRFYSNSASQYPNNNLIITANNNYNQIWLFKSSPSTYTIKSIMLVDLTLMYGEGLEPSLEEFKRHFPDNYYPTNSGTNMEIDNYNQQITTNMSIADSMSYAWKSTWQNDLFSWSYDSFLTQPFLYITNLFNVPATNTLLYCLSYWLNISIIWLCFDVVMYVPLLVHRWLDKGIVE